MVADAALFLFQVYFCDKSLFFTSIARENEAHCKKDSDLVIHTYIHIYFCWDNGWIETLLYSYRKEYKTEAQSEFSDTRYIYK